MALKATRRNQDKLYRQAKGVALVGLGLSFVVLFAADSMDNIALMFSSIGVMALAGVAAFAVARKAEHMDDEIHDSLMELHFSN